MDMWLNNKNALVTRSMKGAGKAITDETLINPLPPLVANEDTTVVLFFVEMNAPMSMGGTISGLKSWQL